MNSCTLISLVRHGHVHNPLGIYYGNMPRYRISDEGILQAQAAAQVLEKNKPAVIFTSPLLRARQTAKIIQAKYNDIPLRRSKLLKEVNTPFDGCQQRELESRNWDIYSNVSPEYEQPIQVLMRIREFVNRARRRYSGQHIIAITHGDLIAFMLLWAKTLSVDLVLKRDLTFFGLSDKYPVPGSVSTFVFETEDVDEVPKVEYINPNS